MLAKSIINYEDEKEHDKKSPKQENQILCLYKVITFYKLNSHTYNRWNHH